MDYDELKKRIDSIDYNGIFNMTPQSVVMLTNGYKEPLVRLILAKSSDLNLQKILFGKLVQKYKAYYIIPLPTYFATLQFDIDCGIPITVSDDETTPAPASTPKDATDEESAPAPTSTPKDDAETDSQEPAQTKQLQAQVKKLQEELAERDATIEELKERIADFESRFPIKDIKSRKVCAMTGKQHVILFLAVLAEHNRLPNARTNLSYLMSFIAARNESSMHDYLKDPITQKECEKLAKEFDTVCPFIAKLIRQLPDKLKEDISKKNSAKASKKVKD